jgi:hypothetical protein
MTVTSAGRPKPSHDHRRRYRQPTGGPGRGTVGALRSSGPVWPRPPNVRVSPGVCLPPTSAAGAEVTADAACSGAPVIVDRYLAHTEVAVHSNPDAGPGAQIAACARLRPVLGQDRLTVGPAWLHRMAVAEPGRFSVASTVSRRAGQALGELMWPPLRAGGTHAPCGSAIPARKSQPTRKVRG